MGPSLSPFQPQESRCFCTMSFEPTKLAHRDTGTLFYFAECQSIWFPSTCRSKSAEVRAGRSGFFWAPAGTEHSARASCALCPETSVRRALCKHCASSLKILWLRVFTSEGNYSKETVRYVDNSIYISVLSQYCLKILKNFINNSNVQKLVTSWIHFVSIWSCTRKLWKIMFDPCFRRDSSCLRVTNPVHHSCWSCRSRAPELQ